jgi:hypothetical protein
LDGISAGALTVRSFGFAKGERMPAERTAMRHVREVLRLKTAGVSGNEIARRLDVAPSTVRWTLQRLAAAGLGWLLPAEMTDAALEAQLFTAVGTKQGYRRHAEPDWAEIHRELKRKHVTLTMLWDEYIERCPDGYRYSRFCRLYRGWASRPLQGPADGSGLHCYWMLVPLFRGKTQLQLEAHAAKDVARAVADRDRMVRAIIE